MTGVLIALGLSMLSGVLLVWAVLGERRPGAAGVLLRVSLGAGLGQGLSGCVTYVVMLACGPSAPAILTAEFFLTAMLVALMVWLLLRRKREDHPAPDASPAPSRGLLVLLSLAVLLLAAAGTAQFTVHAATWPHGASDVLSMWNLRAKQLMEYDESHWRDAFENCRTTHMLNYLNYYPPLHSLVTLRTWKWAGVETQLGPILSAGCFALATLALLITALTVTGGLTRALIAAVVLLGTPNFAYRTSSLYADVPLGFYFLAAVVLIVCHDRFGAKGLGALALAGVATGLALFMKKEGLLFAVVIVVVFVRTCVMRGDRRAGRRRLWAFAAGLTPVLLLFGHFELFVKQMIDRSVPLSVLLSHAVDPQRYGMILKAFSDEIFAENHWLFTVNHWGLFPIVLPFYLLVVGVTRDAADRRAGATALKIVGYWLIGAFVFFVLLMTGLPATLYSTFDRGMLQVWPTVLFGFFLLTRSPDAIFSANAAAPVDAKRRKSKRKRS